MKSLSLYIDGRADINTAILDWDYTLYRLPNSNCIANREGCDYLDYACQATQASCTLLSGTSENDWTPNGCQPPVVVQPCDWQTTACASGGSDCLLGANIYLVPYVPIDTDFPYPCSVGYLGSINESKYQTSSLCADRCRHGSYCPHQAMMEVIICPLGYFCEEGAITPVPCPSGSLGKLPGLTSQTGVQPMDSC